MSSSHELNLEAALAQAADIASEAGAVVRDLAGRIDRVDYKGVVDLVTEADHESEAIIVAALERAFPDHHIHAEEGGGAGAPADATPYTWYIDPLDGTTNFAHGLPQFSISIALTDRERSLVGVVLDPMRGECFTAARGAGAALNGRPIHVSPTPRLSQALASTGFPYDRWTAEDDNIAEWRRFMKRTQGTRRLGSAALDLAWVAMGRLDLFWEKRLNPWDVLAGALLVEEAGGRVTDFEGNRPTPERLGAKILASNDLVHEEALAVFRLGDAAPLPFVKP